MKKMINPKEKKEKWKKDNIGQIENKLLNGKFKLKQR